MDAIGFEVGLETVISSPSISCATVLARNAVGPVPAVEATLTYAPPVAETERIPTPVIADEYASRARTNKEISRVKSVEPVLAPSDVAVASNAESLA